MNRENYGRQTAAGMYLAQKSVLEVSQMLLAEGVAPDQAAELAQTYYQQHLFRRELANKKKLKESGMYRLVGMVLIAGSIFVSFLFYLVIDDGNSFIAYYGAFFSGLLALGKGIVDKRTAKAALKQA
jgi:hypothetical protein